MSVSSRVRLVVIMDPIETIKPAKDSTLAILQAAQARGCELFYAELEDLWLRDGVAFARLAPLEVFNDMSAWFKLGPTTDTRLGDFDVVLMRKDPPFDTEYIYSTYILERAQLQGALVCNRPQGLRDMNEKVYTAWFPECCAPTLITRDMHDMGEFLLEHGKAVCKPLDGMGGKSIFVLEQGDKNRNVVFETLTAYGTRYAIVQRYLPQIVTAGDCRIILVDGEPVPFALQRMPLPSDNRGNLAAGATAESRPLNERDRWLCGQIGPKLRAAGMMFVGLDVIGDYVTEINVTSPTGIREIDKKHGIDIGGMLMDAILKKPANGMSTPPPVSSMLGAGLPPAQDRMLTTCFLAALLHGIVILGITFSASSNSSSDDAAAGLEVVLVNDRAPSAEQNPNARYLSQRTQLGSGNSLKSERTFIPKSSLMPVDRLGVPSGDGLAPVQSGNDAGDEQMVATHGASQKILYFASDNEAKETSQLPLLLEKRPDLAMTPNDDGVELRMRGESKKELWIAADTRESDVAVYLDSWRRKIERVGTMNFPDIARRKKLSGTPVIEVTIGADGKLLNTAVRRTSGHAEIDEAALRILKLAAPFDRFPSELTAKHDEIRIAYEWQFLGGDSQGGSVFYEEPANPR